MKQPRFRFAGTVLVSALLLIGSGVASAAGAETDTQRVARQFREYAMHEATDHGERLLDDVELPKTAVAEATRLLKSMKDDGSWPDVNYANDSRASWQPYDHLTRVQSLIVFARRKGTSAEQ